MSSSLGRGCVGLVNFYGVHGFWHFGTLLFGKQNPEGLLSTCCGGYQFDLLGDDDRSKTYMKHDQHDVHVGQETI